MKKPLLILNILCTVALSLVLIHPVYAASSANTCRNLWAMMTETDKLVWVNGYLIGMTNTLKYLKQEYGILPTHIDNAVKRVWPVGSGKPSLDTIATIREVVALMEDHCAKPEHKDVELGTLMAYIASKKNEILRQEPKSPFER